MRTSQLFKKQMREAVADDGRIQSPAAAPRMSLSFSVVLRSLMRVFPFTMTVSTYAALAN